MTQMWRVVETDDIAGDWRGNIRRRMKHRREMAKMEGKRGNEVKTTREKERRVSNRKLDLQVLVQPIYHPSVYLLLDKPFCSTVRA